jgi:hypothetical protein
VACVRYRRRACADEAEKRALRLVDAVQRGLSQDLLQLLLRRAARQGDNVAGAGEIEIIPEFVHIAQLSEHSLCNTPIDKRRHKAYLNSYVRVFALNILTK